METIIRIALTPDENAKLTPLEVLEDFADASPNWHYLEDASAHYASVKDVPACVLRYRRGETPSYVDLGFAATDAGPLSGIALVILDAPDQETSLDLPGRNDVVDTFLREMRDYLSARPDQATLHVEKDDIPREQTEQEA